MMLVSLFKFKLPSSSLQATRATWHCSFCFVEISSLNEEGYSSCVICHIDGDKFSPFDMMFFMC